MAKCSCQTIKWHVKCRIKIHAQSHNFEMGQDNHTRAMSMRDTTRCYNIQHYETVGATSTEATII
jgi:hypothetical protein